MLEHHAMDAWTISEVFLDLLQDKLLNYQKFYDLSVDERDALRNENIDKLAGILKDKSHLQYKIMAIEREMDLLTGQHPEFIRKMDSQQNIEYHGTIKMMVELLQHIIDYEQLNEEIALQRKGKIQTEITQLSKGNKLLRSYFKQDTGEARFVDKSR